jgi:uncharacterized protein with PCYCGC motif
MKYFFSVVAILLAVTITHAQYTPQDNETPAYHATAPAKGATLPPVLTQAQLAAAGLTQPAQKESYKAAAKASSVMYQMPCYCHCDRHAGHTSLRSCFESTHGANCGTCMAEALYAEKMSRKGWTTKMIRDGVIRGDWKTLDLQNPEPVK